MLPIQTILADLKQQLKTRSQVILQAPPGAGKSTYLPLVLLQEKWFSKKIIMLEPRRLAARNVACYLAKQLNQQVGEQVGYRLRGESKVSANTQLEIVTEGVLIRLLQADPELTGIDLIIFDEFHERNLHADLGLALCLDAQASLCEDLSLLVMSATLDNQSIQQHLPEAGYVSCEGRTYPIDYIYQPNSSLNSDNNQALVNLVKHAYLQQDGNVLVFVAGKKEIVDCCRALQQWVREEHLPVIIAPLYGQLSLQEQQLAIQAPAKNKRKIVVSTNIAETSLTIDGISVVVDSGLVRTVKFQAQTGIAKMRTQFISEASATQRAGRAGRLSAGTCYRLWDKDKRLSAQHEAPILHSELTDLLLETSVWGVNDPQQLPFLTSPHPQNLQVAAQLLIQFKAIDDGGRCTAHGEQIVNLGLSPRLGHMLIKAKQLQTQHQIGGLLALACLLAAQLESNESYSDDINGQLSKLSSQVNHQYKRLLKKCAIKKPDSLPVQLSGMLLAIAYPDRIALQRGNAQDYQLSNGVGARLRQGSHLIAEKMLVVCDLALSEAQASSLIFSACALNLEDVEVYLREYIEPKEHLFWSLSANKLIAEKRLQLGQITLSRSPLSNVSDQQKLQALVNGLRQAGLSLLPWSEADKALLTRLRYAFTQYQLLGMEDAVDYSDAQLLDELDLWLAPFCIGVRQPEQLKKVDLQAALLSRLSWEQQQKIEHDFPKTLQVPTGSNIKLAYRHDQPPLLSVKMQELYGQAETPTVLQGRIAVQLALLSPAMKPLQLTQNLSSFWSGAYKEVQKEMKGRYPKHFWPDDPAQAVATRKTKKYL